MSDIEKASTSLEETVEIRYLEASECRFAPTPGGFVSLQIGDQTYDRIDVHRAFPFSHGDAFLSVRTKEGKEIGIIRRLADFPKEAVRLLQSELDRRYFMPVITKINEIKEEFGYAYWDVETTSGPRRFTVRGLQESILPISPVRLLIGDVEGNRFEIADYRALDPKSFKMIDALL